MIPRPGPIDETAILSELAAILGGKHRLVDRNGMKELQLRGTPKGAIYFVRLGERRGIEIDLAVRTSLVIAIGETGDRRTPTSALLADLDPPVQYVPGSEDQIRAWLEEGGQAAIAGLRLGESDTVRVFQNGIQAYVWETPAPADLAGFVLALGRLADTLPKRPHTTRLPLPVEFSELEPFRRFAETDDARRSELIERARKDVLEGLVRVVVPRLKDIDRVLARAEEPLAEDLIDLQSLAQAALEAQVRLASIW